MSALRPVGFDGLVARLAVEGEIAAMKVRASARRPGRADDRNSLEARILLLGNHGETNAGFRVGALGAFLPRDATSEGLVNPSGSTNVKSEADILSKSDGVPPFMDCEDCSEAARGME